MWGAASPPGGLQGVGDYKRDGGYPAQFQRHMQKISKLAKGAGYNFLTQLTTQEMRGGGWQFSGQGTGPISPQNLENEDGLRVTVLGAHFHHQPSQCEAQYDQLRKHGSLSQMGEHIVLPADHNSVITPGMDAEVATPHDDLPPMARAREMESVFLAELALGDAWMTAFKPSMDPDAHHIPKGWTWGFHMDKPHLVTVDPQLIDTLLN